MVIMKKILTKLYFRDKKSVREIARKFKVSHVTILNWFKKYNISTRNHSESLLGRQVPTESKQKMSLAKIGKTSSFKGKKHTLKARKLMSLHAGTRIGCLSANWQGGLTKLNKRLRNCKKYYNWRKQVFERDNYTCQECDSCNELEAHHIKPFAYFPGYRYQISNGLTLCKGCHNKTKRIINKR